MMGTELHFTNAYAISCLLAGISTSAFGLLVLLKSQNRRLGQVWFAFSASAAVYGFGMWFTLPGKAETSLLGWRLTYGLGVIWIAPIFQHFVEIFLELKTS